MIRTTLTIALCCAAAPVAVAQQVSPTHFTHSAGNDVQLVLGGLGPIIGTRLLQIHEDVPPNTTIREIAFRPVIGNVAARSVIVTVTMSHGVTTALAPDRFFAQNHGNDRTVVASLLTVNLPAVPADLAPPFPASHSIVLTTPFVYTGNGPLCMEIEAYDTANVLGLPVYDWVESPDNSPPVRIADVGGGCVTTGTLGGTFDLGGNPALTWLAPGLMQLVAQEGPRLAPGAFLFGFGVVDLPLPGTAGTASGLCTLRTNPFVSAPVFFTAAGLATMSFPATLDPAFHGLTLTIQAAAGDAAANNFGIVTSNGLALHFVAPFGAQPVGSVNGAPGSSFGAPNPGEGAIVEFR